MTTTMRYPADAPTAYEAFRLGTAVSEGLRVVCLSSALGCALTGLCFALGYGVEIGQALAVAG
jgi:hypothetical protein